MLSSELLIGETMHFTIKFLILIILMASVSGCAYGLQNCNDLAGTNEYDQCFASKGVKSSQYNLGLAAFNEGDTKDAIKWLKRAAEPISGRSAVYIPPVGGQKYGTVMPFDTGKTSAGHRAAQLLLAKIYEDGLGVEKDLKRAEKYKKHAEY